MFLLSFSLPFLTNIDSRQFEPDLFLTLHHNKGAYNNVDYVEKQTNSLSSLGYAAVVIKLVTKNSI